MSGDFWVMTSSGRSSPIATSTARIERSWSMNSGTTSRGYSTASRTGTTGRTAVTSGRAGADFLRRRGNGERSERSGLDGRVQHCYVIPCLRPGPEREQAMGRLLSTVVLAVVLSVFAAPATSALAVWDEITGGDPNSGMVALTFDAGSDDRPTPRILDTLKAYNLKVTFFLTGQWVESYPTTAKR